MIGKELGRYKLKAGENTIQPANLSPGLYFYTLTDQKGNISSGKIIAE